MVNYAGHHRSSGTTRMETVERSHVVIFLVDPIHQGGGEVVGEIPVLGVML